MEEVYYTFDTIKKQIDKDLKPHSMDLPDAKVKLYLDVSRENTMSANLLGMVEGSDPQLKNEYVIIGAHLDHVGMNEDGYVFITGRLKELIIKGGENIAPREVDEALYAHPDVIEAAAFACACDRYGQRIEAGVALNTQSDVSEQDLIDLCTSKIGAFKSPDRIHFMAELPKGPSGKIQRIKLQDLFDR